MFGFCIKSWQSPLAKIGGGGIIGASFRGGGEPPRAGLTIFWFVCVNAPRGCGRAIDLIGIAALCSQGAVSHRGAR